MKPDPTRNARATRYRAAGTLVSVRIGPEAAAVLTRMRETMTVREAVETAFAKFAEADNYDADRADIEADFRFDADREDRFFRR